MYIFADFSLPPMYYSMICGKDTKVYAVTKFHCKNFSRCLLLNFQFVVVTESKHVWDMYHKIGFPTHNIIWSCPDGRDGRVGAAKPECKLKSNNPNNYIIIHTSFSNSNFVLPNQINARTSVNITDTIE